MHQIVWHSVSTTQHSLALQCLVILPYGMGVFLRYPADKDVLYT